MAKKEVTVVINGEEYVSKAAGDAGAAMDGFQKKSGGWINGLADLKAGWDFLSQKIGQAWGLVKDSIAAYDEMRGAQRKLEGTAKLTGVALEELQYITEVGRKAFGLSKVTASDFSAEIAKLTQKAGETDKAADALAAFLNIGAARGLGAADTLKAVQQAILGIDEGTDKLFGKNPSVIYEEFARQIGTTAGKLTDQQKAQALLNEAMDGGIRTFGEYEKYLETSAGKADQFAQSNREAAAQLGESLDLLRKDLLDMGSKVVPWYYDTWRRNADDLTSTLKTLEAASYKVFSATAKLFGKTAEAEEWGRKSEEAARAAAIANDRANKSAKELAESSAMVTVEMGKVIPSYKETGTAAGSMLRPLGDASRLFASNAEEVGKVGPRANMSAKEVEAYGKVSVRAAEDSEKAHKKAEAAALAAHREYLANLARLYEGALTATEVMKRLAPEVQKSFEPERIKAFNDVMDKSRQLGDDLVARMKNVKIDPPQLSTVEKLKLELQGSADELVGVARGALDLAQSFGVVDRTTASALTSVMNIGQAVSKLAGGNIFSGVSGILGGVANIVSTMMAGDTERRRLLAQNNTALDRLRKDIGGLNLRISGDTLVSAQTALAGVIGNLKGGRGAANENDVRNALYAQGLSMEDFDRIAKEFGIEVRTKSGALNVDSVKAVFEAIKTVQLGKVGSDFQSQLDFFTQGQDIGNEQGAGRAMNLLRFLQDQGGVVALAGLDLTDPAKLREQLIALRGQLNSAQGIDESQLGKLSGGQFNDLLVSLLGMLNTGTPTGGGGDVTVPTGGGGGTTSVPSDTIQSVIKAMDNNLASILTSHTVIHERIAVATEGSYTELRTLNGKMDTLIAVSAGTDRIDAALEAERRLLAVQQGTPVTF